MTVLFWDAVALGLALYTRDNRDRPRGAAVIHDPAAGGPWAIGLYGLGRPAEAAVRGLLPGLRLRELGAGRPGGGPHGALVLGPGRGRPRSFATDPRHAARLATLLGELVQELGRTPPAPARGAARR
jgi:hypothetical protein